MASVFFCDISKCIKPIVPPPLFATPPKWSKRCLQTHSRMSALTNVSLNVWRHEVKILDYKGVKLYAIHSFPFPSSARLHPGLPCNALGVLRLDGWLSDWVAFRWLAAWHLNLSSADLLRYWLMCVLKSGDVVVILTFLHLGLSRACVWHDTVYSYQILAFYALRGVVGGICLLLWIFEAEGQQGVAICCQPLSFDFI